LLLKRVQDQFDLGPILDPMLAPTEESISKTEKGNEQLAWMGMIDAEGITPEAGIGAGATPPAGPAVPETPVEKQVLAERKVTTDMAARNPKLAHLVNQMVRFYDNGSFEPVGAASAPPRMNKGMM
jgi:hypothetical protein